MRIGVISDSHDRVPLVEKGVEIFNSSNLEAVLHCGDFVSPFSLLPFKKLDSPFYAVFGNNDGERQGLESIFDDNGWSLNDRPWFFDIKGKRIAMLHEPEPLASIAQSEEFDLLVFGHTHEKLVKKVKNRLIVNPGECCGWVKGKPTVAIVDLELKTCEFIDLE